MSIKTFLVRGDTHGNFTWMFNGCLKDYNPEETAIIILGDAGFNFYLNKTDEQKKKEIDAQGFTFYCVRGNHEARPQDIPNMICIYDDNVNGMVYIENAYPHIRYFLDYGIYIINDYICAVIGGAYSVDKYWRLHRAGIKDELDPNWFNPKKTGWFYNEQLTEQEMAAATRLFANQHFDFVFSHTCPASWEPVDLFLSSVDQTSVDQTMELWLDKLKDKISFEVWCFGHFHADRLERPKVEQYFNDIEDLDVIKSRWTIYEQTGELNWWLAKSPNFYMN